MRTRRGLCYPKLLSLSQQQNHIKHKKCCLLSSQQIKYSEPSRHSHKRLRTSYSHESAASASAAAMFDCLPDDLVIFILSKLSASASCPSDFISLLITCKRLNGLGLHAQVLSKASEKTFAIKAKNWSPSAHKFFKLCADSGNIEACYTLGMIRFYCLQNRASGASLMAKAAIQSHAQALYSLAIIQFNGSGGSKSEKDLRAGVALCARAASLGHIDALREVGHCLQDGYGVRQNVIEGRRFLIQANTRELASVLSMSSKRVGDAWSLNSEGCPLLSDFGCDVEVRERHAASRFLREWFVMKNEEKTGRVLWLRMCSHEGCGRPETRRHEFRRCSVCGNVNYCSRACQALDWKLRHKAECTTVVERWPAAVDAAPLPENDIIMDS